MTRTFVDLGMSPLCESYLAADAIDAPEVFYPLHVLLCDDNVINQKVAMRLLQQMGYRADMAANGLEALALTKLDVLDGRPPCTRTSLSASNRTIKISASIATTLVEPVQHLTQ